MSSKSKDKKAENSKPAKAKPAADLLLASVAGAVMGLSAPGFDQWYIAWFGLAPFFLLAAGADSKLRAGLLGLIYGTTYHLVYLNWYLALHPLSWMGLADWQSILLSALCWLIVSTHQGLMFAVFALLMRFLPLCGGALPRKVEDRWKVPALITLPLLWQLAFERVLNAHDYLGVPWSMIEYSQYKQTAFIQIASLIGGIGVGAIVVMFNVALATLIATASKKFAVKSLASASRLSAVTSMMAVLLVLAGCMIYGLQKMQLAKFHKDQNLSVIQGNINIEMQKARHRYTLPELMEHYGKILRNCTPGICVWTESALPAYLKDSPALLSFLKREAREHQVDMIIGSIDSDAGSRPYNSAFGLTKNGLLLNEVYHKRYLVPVGEYTPEFVKYLPEFLQRLTDTPAGVGFSAGKKPVVLDFLGKHIAPLICFETIAPELVSSSARNGGELIVNISDLAWFHNSMVGDQTSASAIFRAVESGRYFIYAANTGPTIFINPLGVIEAHSTPGKTEMLTAQVSLISEQTPFTQWYN
ncbi:MAG: apolipoprotein N-acyltransferase [Candidatus Obscuribacterales bacterium]|nr:apolipoprotein N-acyltransferase [Candidatus Obscuribacterales bacterium]